MMNILVILALFKIVKFVVQQQMEIQFAYTVLNHIILLMAHVELEQHGTNYIKLSQQFNYQSCLPPYYASFTRECVLCTLENCLYCFEFQYDSELLITLEIHDISKRKNKQNIGCMLCEKDYNFDFNLGICLKKASTIKNCITAYTNVTNEEICLTSSLDNFQISREINSCNQFISYCIICFLDSNIQIQCLVCEPGYILQGTSCYEGQEQSAQYLNEFWDLKVESFLVSIYNSYKNDEKTNSQSPCGDYCLSCKISLGEYYCDKCDKIGDQPKINHLNQMCQLCSPLCQICQNRDEIQTQTMAPLLLNSEMNLYTKECLFPFIDPNIEYNPYLKTAQYCLQGDCNNELTYEFIEYSCFFDRFYKNLDYLGIKKEYLNSIGTVSMTIIIRIEIEDEFCTLLYTISTKASLKLYVFTLQTIHLKLVQTYFFYMHVYNSFLIEEYDSFTMIDFGIVFPNFQMSDLNISNSYNEVNITLINITIKDSSIKDVVSLFKTTTFGYINLFNVSIINSQFINSSLFNFNIISLIGDVKINQLNIFNCTFINSILFEFSYALYPIQFKNIIIDQSQLQNSSIFNFRANNPLDIQIYLISISIYRSKFNQSNFFYCSQQIDVIATNLIFNFNQLSNSIIFGFSSGLQSSYIEINQNIFYESSFISTNQMINQQFASCNIMNLIIRSNIFQNSNLFQFFSQFQLSDLFVKIDNVIIEFNDDVITNNLDQQLSNTANQVSYLFNINGKQIILNNFKIYQNKKIHIINLFDSQNIILENFVFENAEIKEKISAQANCLQNLNFQNQILQIVGFNNISISNFKIKYIQSIDESIIKIMSNGQYSQQNIGQITIINLEYYGNLLQQIILNDILNINYYTINEFNLIFFTCYNYF